MALATRVRRLLLSAAALAACLSSAGCAGYRVGSASLFPADIKTVYVPIFQSDSYRRYLGEQITEEVIKEIEKRTNYRVVNTPNADSVLSGRLLNETKNLLVESPTDEARESQQMYVVEVTWLDRQGVALSQGQTKPLPAATANITQTSSIVPEVGQSNATSQETLAQGIARQVVSLMENPW
ncbi:MAG TPA: LptE family protein [Pirellulales bacterium]